MAYTKYSLTPANNNAAPPDGAPEGMLPSAVNDTMRDMMAQIRDVGDGIRGGTYTMTAPVITGGSISGLSSLASTGVATFSAGSVSAPAITTTGDTNTGIFFPAADTIAFTEGGVESMRINSSGQLGIGTTSPTVPLQIYNATNASILMQGDAGANLTIQRYSTNSTQPSLILFKARGTLASPTAVATGDQIGSVVFQAYGGTNTRSIAGIRGYAETYTSDTDISSYLWFGTTPSGTTSIAERMRIDSSGNVGIGTSSPSFKLDVSGANGNGIRYLAAGGTSVIFGDAGGNSAYIGTLNNYPVRFTVNDTERVRIDTSGNVGIGTSSPGRRLDVSAATGLIGVTSTTGTNYAAFQALNTGGTMTLGLEGSSPVVFSGATAYSAIFGTGGAYSLHLATSNTVRATIDSSGNLWAGTTTFSSSMQSGFSVQTATNSQIWVSHANGTGTGQLYSGFFYDGGLIGSITQNGTTGVLYNLTSDYRLKDNPVPLTGASEFIMALQPKTWDWYDGSGKGVGFIAHEFMEVAKYSGNGTKDQVDSEGKPIYQSIQPSSSEVMANLVALVQELKAEFDAYKATHP